MSQRRWSSAPSLPPSITQKKEKKKKTTTKKIIRKLIWIKLNKIKPPKSSEKRKHNFFYKMETRKSCGKQTRNCNCIDDMKVLHLQNMR
jgi:hypothetical protein